MRGKLISGIQFAVIILTAPLFAEEFTLLVYNVENLFDVDGMAHYKDYKQQDTKNPHPYNSEKLFVKIRNVTRILRQFSDGRGPDIVVFQEFENDRSPFSTVEDWNAFLDKFADVSLKTMLTSEFDTEISGLPVEAFLLKYLDDEGLSGYNIAQPTLPRDLDSVPVHKCVIFTKFPVTYIRQHPIFDARDILEVGLSINGHPLIIFNNHWKTGASWPETEPTRVKNARTLRKRLDEILRDDPSADVILAGDFNTHYNQSQVLTGVLETGLQSVLRSQGDELALQLDGGPDIYNLWFDLRPDKRRNEPYRGHWGTLMQILLTRGLYDYRGVQYVDNSFFVAEFPGLNAGRRFKQPISWRFFGDGGGFSDHFPVAAVFKTVDDNNPDHFMVLDEPGKETFGADHLLKVNYQILDLESVPEAQKLASLSDSALGEHFDEVFQVKTQLVSKKPLAVSVGSRTIEIWSYDNRVLEKFDDKEIGDRVNFIGQLGEHRGRLQFIIQHPNWIK